jgi:hypothetical protein
MFFKR